MSFHTLQELNLDAARYRWLRQQTMSINFYDASDSLKDIWVGLDAAELDEQIDEELARDE